MKETTFVRLPAAKEMAGLSEESVKAIITQMEAATIAMAMDGDMEYEPRYIPGDIIRATRDCAFGEEGVFYTVERRLGETNDSRVPWVYALVDTKGSLTDGGSVLTLASDADDVTAYVDARWYYAMKDHCSLAETMKRANRALDQIFARTHAQGDGCCHEPRFKVGDRLTTRSRKGFQATVDKVMSERRGIPVNVPCYVLDGTDLLTGESYVICASSLDADERLVEVRDE